MPKGNPHPNTAGIEPFMGKGRPRLDHPTVAIRMSPATKEALERLAEQYRCLHGGKAHIGGLLAKIGAGELLVVPAPPGTRSE
jgi:hypothetical protein